MSEIVGAQFFKTVKGIFSSPTDFLFWNAAMDAAMISGLTKRMGKVFTRRFGLVCGWVKKFP